MGVFIYKIKDRQTGKVLFTGREGAAAEYLGCAHKYLYQLAVGEVRSSKKTAFSHVVVSRQWQDEPVRCVDCGVEIPGAGPTRERCDDCRKKRRGEIRREHSKKAKEQRATNRVEYAVSQGEMQKDCVGCIYFGGQNYINRSCNYIFKEGHSRGCPPGAGCTKRKPKKRKNRK